MASQKKKGGGCGAACLVVLALASFSFSANSPIYTVIGIGLLILAIARPWAKEAPTTPGNSNRSSGDSGSYEGRMHIDKTRFYYDNEGNLQDIEDGLHGETIDGRIITPNNEILDRDDDGEIRYY